MKNLIQIEPPASEHDTESSELSSGGLLAYLEKALRKDPEATVVVREVLIPMRPSPWSAFGAAVVLQVIIITILVAAPLLFPEKFEAVHRYFVTTLAKNEKLTPPRRAPYKARALNQKSKEVAQVSPEETAEPAPFMVKVYSPIASSPLAKPSADAQMKQAAPSVPLTETLPSSNLPAFLVGPTIPDLKRPREGVQTGGFDAGENSEEARPVVGRGPGNGTVVDALFSHGVADRTGHGSGAGIRQGLFPDEHARGVVRGTNPTLPAKASTTPVKILEKPRPLYTSEGRAQKIEGEVLLQAVFMASGKVSVIRVVRGLGHGLDGSAQEAAQRIKFEPALKDGEPVDSPAIIHIVFELAY